MIFRLATSVLEKRRESISVDGAPLVPNWDSLQNLRAKIKKAAAERLEEKKRVAAAGRLAQTTVTSDGRQSQALATEGTEVEEQGDKPKPIKGFLDLTHQNLGLSVEETLDIDEGEEGHDRHGINLSVVQMKMLEDGTHHLISQLSRAELRELIEAA